MTISIIIPCYNEQDNILILLDEIREVLEAEALTGEVVVVDDGSTDNTFSLLRQACTQFSWLKVIRLRRNFGQTAAMVAGMDHATGQVIIPMDADRQNDPKDIPRLLAKMEEDGAEVISGWRQNRKDKAITRKLPSRLANALISRISGVRLHDYGCTLKAYRRSVLDEIRLYGEMHRFIPIYAHWAGARVVELPVGHRPRVAGKSKYGLNRTFKVILDLITVKFLGSYSTKPIYFFGSVGLTLLAIGIMAGGGAIVHRFFSDPWPHRVPLLLFAGFSFLAGLQLVLIGLLAEILIRTYHESQGKRIYMVGHKLGMERSLCSVGAPPHLAPQPDPHLDPQPCVE